MKVKRFMIIILLYFVKFDDFYIYENKNMEIIYVLLIDEILKV